MTTIETTQALWQTIPGAEPLFEIYGYWPTLHDAVVRELKIGFAERELTLVLDYSDHTIAQEEREISTRITLCWSGIIGSKLRLNDGYLYGIKFTRRENHIETKFDDYAFGMDGLILAEKIRVIQIERSPEGRDDGSIQMMVM